MKTIRAAGLTAATVFLAGCTFRSSSDNILAIAQETANVRQAGVSQLSGLNLNVRGLNAVGETGSGGVVIDGIAMSNPAVLTRTIPDIATFEITKGPQGTGASAAAIMINTVPPGTGNSLRATLAEDNTYSFQAAVGGDISPDKLTYGLTAAVNSSDGFYRNDFLEGRKVDDTRAFDLGGRLIYSFDENSGLDLKVHWGERRAADSTFDGAFGLPTFAQFLNQPLFNEDINSHAFAFQSNIRPQHRQRAADVSLRWVQDITWATLTAWTLYSDVNNSLVMDGAAGLFGTFSGDPACRASTTARFTAGKTLPAPQRLGSTPEGSFFGLSTFTTCDGTHTQIRDQNDISAEVRLSSAERSAPLTWDAGVLFQHINRLHGSSLGIDQNTGAARDVFVPAGGMNPTEQLYFDKLTTTGASVFGEISYDVFETFTVTAGGRFERERQGISNRVPAGTTRYLTYAPSDPQTGGAALNPARDPFFNPSGVIPDQHATFDQASPKVALSWKVQPTVTLHASWNTGFKSGGFNNAGTAATVDLFLNTPLNAGLGVGDAFAKERSSAFEGGFEAMLFNGSFSFGVTGYHTRVKNLQFAEVLAGPFGILRAVENIGRARITGAESEFQIRYHDRLRVFGGASAQSTKIVEMAARPDAVGNRLPYAPKYTFNGGAEALYPITENFGVFGRADVAVTGPTAFHPIQCQTRPTIFGVSGTPCGAVREAFTTVDLRAGVGNKQWQASVFVKNLLNDAHVGEAIVVPELGFTFLRPDALRRVGADLKYNF